MPRLPLQQPRLPAPVAGFNEHVYVLKQHIAKGFRILIGYKQKGEVERKGTSAERSSSWI
jgi:hypothetical protein